MITFQLTSTTPSVVPTLPQRTTTTRRLTVPDARPAPLQRRSDEARRVLLSDIGEAQHKCDIITGEPYYKQNKEQNRLWQAIAKAVVINKKVIYIPKQSFSGKFYPSRSPGKQDGMERSGTFKKVI